MWALGGFDRIPGYQVGRSADLAYSADTGWFRVWALGVGFDWIPDYQVATSADLAYLAWFRVWALCRYIHILYIVLYYIILYDYIYNYYVLIYRFCGWRDWVCQGASC